MRYIYCFLLAIFLSFTSFAQEFGGPKSTVRILGGLKADSVLQLPIIDTSYTTTVVGVNTSFGLLAINKLDSLLVLYKGGHWIPLGTSSVVSPDGSLVVSGSSAQVNYNHSGTWLAVQIFQGNASFGPLGKIALVTNKVGGANSVNLFAPDSVKDAIAGYNIYLSDSIPKNNSIIVIDSPGNKMHFRLGPIVVQQTGITGNVSSKTITVPWGYTTVCGYSLHATTGVSTADNPIVADASIAGTTLTWVGAATVGGANAFLSTYTVTFMICP